MVAYSDADLARSVRLYLLAKSSHCWMAAQSANATMAIGTAITANASNKVY
eukprot:m.308529 g.308529  ORF g.308529 m.308529 type:complete len:51 (+) comp44157_c0_seq1:1701-1853(+)